MGMSGRFNKLKPDGFKPQSTWNGGTEVDKDGNQLSGNCISCGEWDSELKDGFCRGDEACKRKRQSLAIMEGRAIKILTDLPNKTKIIYSKEGKTIVD